MTITVGGTSITFNDSTTQSTAATGTVTSVATGNGLQGGTITGSGTLSIACPTFNTVGSYAMVKANYTGTGFSLSSGSNYSAGGGNAQIMSVSLVTDFTGYSDTNNLSGTWKWMGNNTSFNYVAWFGIACRVS